MTKILIPSLLTMAFSVAGFSQTIVRTAKLNLNDLNYSVEVQIEKKQSQKYGAGIRSNVSLVSYGDVGIDAVYVCEEQLTIQGDVEMTYILKNAEGQEVSRQVAAPQLTARAGTKAGADSVCQKIFPARVDTMFVKADQAVNFKLAEGVISVSANFSARVVGADSYTATVDESSLKQVRYYLNYENAKDATLIDPANPPVEDENPYCVAHPYDCE